MTPNSLPVVLLSFANDRNDETRYLRNLPDELRQLREALRPAVNEGLCEVVELANATADDIFKVFQSRKYRNRIAVFHFGGHAGGYELLLENADGHAASANAGGFAKFLAEQSSLELVFLNGCSTRKQTQGLLDAGVDAVITTARAIDDAIATKLSQRFYRALAAGAGLSSAFRESVAAVETEGGNSTRALYAVSAETDEVVADQLPWDLFFRPGAESAGDWNLPNTVRNPLFGLPRPEKVDLPQCPYRHLQWFRREHAEVFFGRGQEIRDLYQKATNPNTAPIILFYGQSGVGKSSLLDAGLLPRLETSQHVIYLRRDGEQGLAGTLDLAFLPEGVDLPPRKAWLAREKSLGRPLTIVLDQVEEVFTRPCGAVSDELGMFLDYLNEIFHDHETRPQGRLIVGFRKEWLAEIKRQLADARLPYTEVFLERLDRRGILEVVNGPALTERLKNQYGLKIEAGLAQQIADDLLEDASGAVAPTLQILLSRMWEAATHDGTSPLIFSRELYSSMRRQGLLLRDFLNRQLEFVEQRWPDAVSPDLLLDLLSLHTTALGTAEEQIISDLQKSYSHHAENLPQILDGCRDAYLLTLPGSAADDDTATRLAHDTLAPLVRERFEASDHPGQRARRILENRVIEWQGGATGAPLDEVDLTIVEAGRSGMRAWTADEERMIEASRNERGKRLRRKRIRRGLGIAAVLMIAAMAGVAFVYAVHANEQRAIAEKHQQEAEEHEVAAQKATARGVIIPLREFDERHLGALTVSEPTSASELEALWLLVSQQTPSFSHYTFAAAFQDPKLCERVVNRAPELVRAAVGLDQHQRELTLELIHLALTATNSEDRTEEPPDSDIPNRAFSLFSMPLQHSWTPPESPQFDPEKVDWRVVCACAAVANELRPLEHDMEMLIASRLSAELDTRDPRLLGEIGTTLTRFAAALTPEQATQSIHRLLNPDLEKTAGSYPVKAGKAIEAILPALSDSSCMDVLRRAVDRWRGAQHSEKIAMQDVIVGLSRRFPADDALSAWKYLEEHHHSYQPYMIPAGYFGAMGRVAEKAEHPEVIALRTAAKLQKAEERYRNLYAYQDTLTALSRVMPEAELHAHVSDSTKWRSSDVHQWVQSIWNPTAAPAPDPNTADMVSPERSVANSLVDIWQTRTTDLNHWLSEDNVEQVTTELINIASATDNSLANVKAAIRILGAMTKTDEQLTQMIPHRESIRRSLSERLQRGDDQSIYNDVTTLECLQMLALPADAEVDKVVQQRILDGLRSQYGEDMVSGVFTLNVAPRGEFLKELVDIAIEKMESADLSESTPVYAPDFRTVAAYGRLLMLPEAKIPQNKYDSVCSLTETLYRRVLHPKDGSPRGYQVRELPGPADFLPQDLRQQIATELESLFMSEVGHTDLTAFAIARSGFGVPVSPALRRSMLIKLSLWMYRLPPPIINTSPPRQQTHVPAELAGAMLNLSADADDQSRTVCAHAIMHAMLQLDFHEQSGQALRSALQQIATQCGPQSLVDILKAPWCVNDAQAIVVAALEKHAGASFNGQIWAIYDHRDKLQVSEEDLMRPIQFPPELQYDAKVPTYAMAANSAPRPLGQGNPMADDTADDTHGEFDVKVIPRPLNPIDPASKVPQEPVAGSQPIEPPEPIPAPDPDPDPNESTPNESTPNESTPNESTPNESPETQ